MKNASLSSSRTPFLGQNVSSTPPINWNSESKIKLIKPANQSFSAIDAISPGSSVLPAETPPMLDPAIGTYCMSEAIDSQDEDDAKSISVLSDISDFFDGVVDHADDLIEFDFSWTQCVTSFAWLSHIVYVLAGIYGVAACTVIILVKRGYIPTDFIGSDDAITYVFSDAVVAAYLLFAGMLAAYEIHVLGTLQDAIKTLCRCVGVMNHNIISIRCDIDKIGKELGEYEHSIDTLSHENVRIRSETKSQCSSLKDLRATLQRQEKDNASLQDKLATLMKKNATLEKTMAECQNVVSEQAVQINRMKSVRNSIRNASVNGLLKVGNLLHEYQIRLDRMRDLKRHQQKLILQQISYRSEFKDHKIGFSKKEFKLFFRMLPENFRDVAKQYNFDDFNDLKGDDGCVSRATIDSIIDRLVEHAEEIYEDDLSAFGKM